MNVKQLLESYGYLPLSLIEYDGLYYFGLSMVTIAVEFLPELYTDVPETRLPLMDFENVIPGNIVGAKIGDTICIFNEAYQLHLEEKWK